MAKEIIFLVEEAPEGGYTARAIGYFIFTEGDDMEGLKEAVRDAVKCHFEDKDIPQIIRLHFVKDEIISPASRVGNAHLTKGMNPYLTK